MRECKYNIGHLQKKSNTFTQSYNSKYSNDVATNVNGPLNKRWIYQDIDFLATGRQWGKIKIFVTYNGQS